MIKGLFASLAERAGKMTEGQLQLVKGMQRYYRKHKELSEKQLTVLNEILKYSGDETVPF